MLIVTRSFTHRLCYTTEVIFKKLKKYQVGPEPSERAYGARVKVAAKKKEKRYSIILQTWQSTLWLALMHPRCFLSIVLQLRC